MKAFFEEIKYNYNNDVGMLMIEGEKFPRILAFCYMLDNLKAIAHCKIRGHNYKENLICTENGHSCIECTRCGLSHDIYM